MIIDNNINPKRDLYYLGGIMIAAFQNNKGEEIDYMDLYAAINTKQEITINLFLLTLDWLFILGLVSIGKNGKLVKCF